MLCYIAKGVTVYKLYTHHKVVSVDSLGDKAIQENGLSFFLHLLVEKSCIYEGVVHLNGERWSVSECVSCECLHGQSICEWTKCPSAPEGCLAERMPGQCCPNIRCPGTLYGI